MYSNTWRFDVISKLLQLSGLALLSTKKYSKKRFLFVRLQSELKNKSIVILSGSRGVGKTILLKQLVSGFKNSFYLSVDQLRSEDSLFDIAKTLQEKYKIKYLILAEQFLVLLSRAFLLQVILPKGANVIREPKILMGLPYWQLFKNYDDAIGPIREDFVVEILCAQEMLEISYLKSNRGEKTPDFLVTDREGNEIVIEVGGRGKGHSQFKGIESGQKPCSLLKFQ
jgi:predicted AAA+ superfamily ATPase